MSVTTVVGYARVDDLHCQLDSFKDRFVLVWYFITALALGDTLSAVWYVCLYGLLLLLDYLIATWDISAVCSYYILLLLWYLIYRVWGLGWCGLSCWTIFLKISFAAGLAILLVLIMGRLNILILVLALIHGALGLTYITHRLGLLDALLYWAWHVWWGVFCTRKGSKLIRKFSII